MNIFLPFSDNVKKSVESLDSIRLQKQIVECYQLLIASEKEKDGEAVKLYHPIYLFYKNNPQFLAHYGYECCREYYYRNKKDHSLMKVFYFYMSHYKLFGYDCDGWIEFMEIPKFIPYYMEGSKNTPECIRTTKFVSELFRAKLIKKWLADKKQPTWDNRNMPAFFEEYLRMNKVDQDNYWNEIEKIKNEVRNINGTNEFV